MKVAFIIQRYGTEILGGSEYHCRLVAERLAARHQVDVLTTCARDYVSWANEYPEGADRVRGVTVRRFANARTRDIASFNEYSDWIFNNHHSADDEQEWLKQQGPWCPTLIEYLEQRHASYDALIFFTYLYAPTVLGLKVDPRRSVLVPTAHDEPAIRLDLYRDVFNAPAGIAYNTGVERAFLRSQFTIDAKADEIVGCGVDLPAQFASNGSPSETHPSVPLSRSASNEFEGEDEDKDAADDIVAEEHRQPTAAAFRRRHRLYGPFALYGGRIDPGKGCEELIAHFGSYASEHGDATLALMGVKLMPIPEEPYIRFAGLLSEHERLEALNAATVVVVPSPYESLSLLALEAFAVGTPVLANARSDVVTDHCQRSNGGLYYADREEFVECLRLLMGNDDLRAALGRNGQAYVKANYEWDVILEKYDRLLSGVSGKKIARSGRASRSPSSSRSSSSSSASASSRGSRSRGRARPRNARRR